MARPHLRRDTGRTAAGAAGRRPLRRSAGHDDARDLDQRLAGTRLAVAGADGWGRGQWYTARWADRLLFPENGPSVDHLVPEWQELKVGDRVLDGAPQKKCAFVVAAVEPDRHLVLRSREHLPPEWVDRFGASIDWSWAFVLDRLPGDRTRLIFRSRFHLEPRGVEAFNVGVIIPADFRQGSADAARGEGAGGVDDGSRSGHGRPRRASTRVRIGPRVKDVRPAIEVSPRPPGGDDRRA